MKSNIKILGIIVSLCLVVVASFSICSYAKTGNYATLNGSCTYNVSNGTHTAYASSMNISDRSRYINISLKTTNSAVITSRGRSVSVNTSIETPYTNVTSYSYVYTYCTVYNSSSPSSGSIENLILVLR